MARVLVVDDDKSIRRTLEKLLQSDGHQVLTAADGREAIAALPGADLVLLDLGMPEVDGFDLISRIRASDDPRVRDVPAAALTAFARSEDRTKALRSGFEMHLAKPVDPGELVASVGTLVRRARARPV